MEVNIWLYPPTALCQGKGPNYMLNMRLHGSQSRYGEERIYFLWRKSNYVSSVVQAVFSRPPVKCYSVSKSSFYLSVITICYSELMDLSVFDIFRLIDVRINSKMWSNTFELILQYLQDLCWSEVNHLNDYDTPFKFSCLALIFAQQVICFEYIINFSTEDCSLRKCFHLPYYFPLN